MLTDSTIDIALRLHVRRLEGGPDDPTGATDATQSGERSEGPQDVERGVGSPFVRSFSIRPAAEESGEIGRGRRSKGLGYIPPLSPARIESEQLYLLPKAAEHVRARGGDPLRVNPLSPVEFDALQAFADDLRRRVVDGEWRSILDLAAHGEEASGKAAGLTRVQYLLELVGLHDFALGNSDMGLGELGMIRDLEFGGYRLKAPTLERLPSADGESLFVLRGFALFAFPGVDLGLSRVDLAMVVDLRGVESGGPPRLRRLVQPASLGKA